MLIEFLQKARKLNTPKLKYWLHVHCLGFLVLAGLYSKWHYQYLIITRIEHHPTYNHLIILGIVICVFYCNQKYVLKTRYEPKMIAFVASLSNHIHTSTGLVRTIF